MSSPQMLHHLRRTSLSTSPSDTRRGNTCEIHGTYTDYQAARDAAYALLHPPTPSRSPSPSSQSSKKHFAATASGHLTVPGSDNSGINGAPLVRIESHGGTGYELVVETGWNTPGLRGNEQGKVDDELWYVIQRTVRPGNLKDKQPSKGNEELEENEAIETLSPSPEKMSPAIITATPTGEIYEEQAPAMEREDKEDLVDDEDGQDDTTEIEIIGTHLSRAGAEQAARTALQGENRSGNFTVYEEYHGQEDWPYGEDVLVYAVGSGGEEVDVSVWHKPKGK